MKRRLAIVLALSGVLVSSLPRLLAHDIPSDVQVRMFFKPQGSQLRVLVRVPLAAIIETDWPERGPGLLDLSRADRPMRDGALVRVADDLSIFEGDRRLDAPRVAAVMASLPSDRSFDTYDQALAHTTGPRLPDDAEFVIAQGLLDVLFEYPIQSDRSSFSIHPNFLRLGLTVQTTVRFQPPDRDERMFSLHNDPGVVRLDPNWFQAAWLFARDGFEHILYGADHLLFLFCLIIPFRNLRSLAAIITSFTVAHSVALIASAYGMTPAALWFPAVVDALIALSILYVALDNLIAPSLRRRWIVAFVFGLAHGFGFAVALSDSLQFAGSHFLTSLVFFNLGLEAGMLAALLVMVPLVALIFQFAVEEKLGTIILSLLVAHTGWHWTVDRVTLASRYQFQMPTFDAAFFVIAIRWVMIAVVLGGLGWLIFGVYGRGKNVESGNRVIG
jgi:HupE / UreJ protein